MAGTRRSTRSAVSTPAPSTRNLRPRGSSKVATREESDKENTPPKNTNALTTEASDKAPQTQEICGICLDAVNAVKGSLPVCVHTFCFECIHQWSKTSNTCPMCKAKFRMINRAEVGSRKPKKVRVSDVDQRAEYSDPDPDDFLTDDDEEDSGDDIIFFGASMFTDFENAWMDADDGEFAGYIVDSDDDDDEEEDEDDEELQAELVNEEEDGDDEDIEEVEEDEDDEETDWGIQCKLQLRRNKIYLISGDTHIAHALALDRGLVANNDSDYDSDCICEDAPVTRSRSRTRASPRIARRSTRNSVIAIEVAEDEEEEEDEDGEEASDDVTQLRRSTRLSRRGLTSTPTLVIDLVSESEECESSASEEEAIRTVHTRSRSYPTSNHLSHHSNHTHYTREESNSPRLTRSTSRTRGRNGGVVDQIANETPSRITRSRSALPQTPTTPPTIHATHTPTTTHSRTRQRDSNNNNNNAATYTDPEDAAMGRGKRMKKSPTRFGFQDGSRPTTPTTTTTPFRTTTTTTTTSTTWSNHADEDDGDEVEDEDEEMETESRYNLRSRRQSVST